MIKRISVVFISLFIATSIYSQWVQGWYIDNGEFGKAVTISDTFVCWVIANTFYQDTSTLYKINGLNGLRKLPMQDFMYIDIITCIAAYDTANAWIGTNNGRILHTTNGGQNWVQQINVGGSGYLNDIKFSDSNPNVGFANSDPPNGAGTPFKIFKTTDRGNNWIEYSVITSSDYLGTSLSSCVTDENHYWMGLNCQSSPSCTHPSILLTTNGGLNWVTTTVSNFSHTVSSVVFRTDNVFGFATPWDVLPVNIYQSLNGGMSWIVNETTQHQNPLFMDWAEGTSVWYYSTSEFSAPVYKSSDNGTNWYPMETENYNEQIIHFDVKRINNAIFGYAITYSGKILQLFGDTVTTIGIQYLQNSLPKEFSLSQNYPNPFNPTTNIKYQIPKSSFVKMTVYDILGKEVAVLVNEKQNPGTYEVEWNGSNYPSGVYFYKLTVSDPETSSGLNFTETKKLILLK